MQLTDAERTHLLEHVAQGIGFSNQSGQEIRIHVRPPELGSLQIDVSVKDGALSARLEAQTSAAQQILQDNLPELKEALAQQGLTVDRIEVRLADPSANSGNRSDVAEHSFAQNQQSQRDGSPHQEQRAPDADPDQPGNGPQPVRSARQGLRGLRQLDITV